MTTRYDIIATREYERNGEKKTAYTRIGVAWPLKNGDGFSLEFDALPVSGRAILKPPMPKDDQPRQERREAPKAQLQSMYTEDEDSEIPF